MSLITSASQQYFSLKRSLRLWSYKRTGYKPWARGFVDFRNEVVVKALNDESLLKQFRDSLSLPEGFGARLDERVVEYPWVVSQLTPTQHYLLDAGSTLNFDFILTHPHLSTKTVVIYNLAPETILRSSNISYIYGDLRATILRDEAFDIITCISVLEHIGMDNTMLYSQNLSYKQASVNDYKDVLIEFHRILKRGGKLLLTIPFGRYENHGWLQQFDSSMISDVINVFQPATYSVAYYKYSPEGWNTTTAEECSDVSYHDVHKDTDLPSDYAAAARAIACLVLVK